MQRPDTKLYCPNCHKVIMGSARDNCPHCGYDEKGLLCGRRLADKAALIMSPAEWTRAGQPELWTELDSYELDNAIWYLDADIGYGNLRLTKVRLSDAAILDQAKGVDLVGPVDGVVGIGEYYGLSPAVIFVRPKDRRK